MFTLKLENYRAIRSLHWTAEETGVHAIIGPNNCGASTLLEVLNYFQIETWQEFRRTHCEFSPHRGNFLNLKATDKDRILISLEQDFWHWKAHFHGSRTVFFIPTEDEFLFPPTQCDYQGVRFRHYPHYDIVRLLAGNDNYTPPLHPSGTNLALALYEWYQKREETPNFAFIKETLCAMFPEILDIIFTDWRNFEIKTTMGNKSFRDMGAGTLRTLLNLAAVASVQPHGIVALECPETSLHPFAIHVLIRHLRKWSHAQDVDILLRTHSGAVLDTFEGLEENVLCFDAAHPGLPKLLTEHKDKEWFGSLRLGACLERGVLTGQQRI